MAFLELDLVISLKLNLKNMVMRQPFSGDILAFLEPDLAFSQLNLSIKGDKAAFLNAVYMGKPIWLKNPHLRARLAESLECLLPHHQNQVDHPLVCVVTKIHFMFSEVCVNRYFVNSLECVRCYNFQKNAKMETYLKMTVS